MIKAVELALPLGTAAIGAGCTLKVNQQIANQSTTTDLSKMPGYKPINVNKIVSKDTKSYIYYEDRLAKAPYDYGSGLVAKKGNIDITRYQDGTVKEVYKSDKGEIKAVFISQEDGSFMQNADDICVKYEPKGDFVIKWEDRFLQVPSRYIDKKYINKIADHSNYGADAHRRYEAYTIRNIMIEMRSLVTKLQYDDPNESGYWDPKNNIFNNVNK